jgi:hypothetical protein
MTSNPQYPEMALNSVSDWCRTPGEIVEIRSGDKVLRRGQVDATMPNGTGLWLSADGAHLRTYIDKDDGFELWAEQAVQNP